MEIVPRTLDHSWNRSREDDDEDELGVLRMEMEAQNATHGLNVQPRTQFDDTAPCEISQESLLSKPGALDADTTQYSRIRFLEDPLLIPEPRRPIFNPSSGFEAIRRPIGYEDRYDNKRKDQRDRRRTRSTSATRRGPHPHRYTTDWNAFALSAPLSDPPSETTTLQGEEFNIKASNIDRHLSNDEIEAFFRDRCGPINAFRLENIDRSKVAYLSLDMESAKQKAIALHGFRLGRHRVKIEWCSKG